jgi:acyl-coenzyme A thioesterase PaaI-like protein
VAGYFTADSRFEGYSGIVHGGIIATLLDSAMSHSLFKKGVRPLTGSLSIRYSCPIQVGTLVKLEGRIRKRMHKIFFLEAAAFINGENLAYAEGRYVRRGEVLGACAHEYNGGPKCRSMSMNAENAGKDLNSSKG